ncbi:MAG: CBS domain-containing protein [Candidatus Undinarchaeales archaeon]
MTQIKEIMNSDVKVAEKGTTILKALKKMDKHEIGSLVIVDKNEAVGIITSSDVLYKAVVKEKDIKKMKVEEIMSKDLVTIDPDAKLEEAAAIMADYSIKKLPVTNEKDELLGIITAMDLLAHSPDFSNMLVNIDLPQQNKLMGS